MSRLLALSLKTFTIGQFMLMLSAFVMVIAVIMVLLLSTFIERRAVGDLAHEEARQTSELIFQALYSAMRKGWDKDEIRDIVDRLNSTRPDATIAVWRGPPVIDQYGDIPGEAEQRDNDPLVMRALTTGEESLVTRRDMLRYLYPVTVKEECLDCHVAPLGAVNGLVDITFPVTNLKVSLGFVIRSVIFYFAVVLSIILLVLYFKLRYFIAFPITQFVQVIDDIIQHTDLNRRIEGKGSNLRELQKLSDHFNKLLTTVQDYSQRLETYSQRDPLTDLYNRRKFEDFLRHEVERARRSGRPFSLIMLDVDNFKHINDTYGHPVGDLALKEITAILQSRLRKTDIVARLGGDEFAILLPETSHEQGLRVADIVHTALAQAVIHLPVGNTRISGSLGLVSFPENGTDVEKLNIAMDVAMYKAKRLGKNRVATLDSSEEDTVMEVFNKGQELQRALDEGRLIPFFQPICFTDGQPYGCEVLARIREGDTTISAGEFIELAEELGLARAVDEAVFRGALTLVRDGAAASGKPYTGHLFFNLSARTVGDQAWLRGIPGMAREHGLDPSQIVLEITEREALPQFDSLLAGMEELRTHGVRFALDDFGSGFSSFLYLKYLTVDYVKIEGSFVRHIATDHRDRIMVEHIHGMAKQFGLKTIAEFVEDEDTAQLLREIGIDLGQGYHFGHPSVDPAGTASLAHPATAPVKPT